LNIFVGKIISETPYTVLPVSYHPTKDTANNLSATGVGRQARTVPGNIFLSLHDMEGKYFASFPMIIIRNGELKLQLTMHEVIKVW
jgi:hypothetical protein